MSWYIETWNPADGLAFIALREDGRAVEVFFVGAPQFHPLPVRNVATAWWAARGTFQEGALNTQRPLPPTNGRSGGYAEIAFPTLAQAITFVRRVFTALGPEFTPTSHTTAPPLVLGPQGSALALNIVQDLTIGADKRQLASRLGELAEDPQFSADARRFLLYALSSMPSAADGDLEADERRVALLVMLEKSGLWPNMGALLEDWKANLGAQREAVAEWQVGRLPTSGAAVQASLMKGLLFAVPAPIPMPFPYGRGFTTLGHHLCAASSDRAYLTLVDTSERFLPLFATSLLLSAATVDLTPGSNQFLRRIAERAGKWLATAVPDTSLSDVDGAEALITDLVRKFTTERDSALAVAEGRMMRKRIQVKPAAPLETEPTVSIGNTVPVGNVSIHDYEEAPNIELFEDSSLLEVPNPPTRHAHWSPHSDTPKSNLSDDEISIEESETMTSRG